MDYVNYPVNQLIANVQTFILIFITRTEGNVEEQNQQNEEFFENECNLIKFIKENPSSLGDIHVYQRIMVDFESD